MNLLSLDFFGRTLLALAFTTYACLGALGLISHVTEIPTPDNFLIELISRLASLSFMVLLITFTVIRLPPKDISLGWMPRVAAILGTFMILTVGLLPAVDTSPGIQMIGTIMILLGALASIYCIFWLGRSFSIDAQARRLVVGGPYSIVRHPLYAAEAIAIIGMALSNFSGWSVALVSVNLIVQYWRILNEERVLRTAFPEYDSYALSVPMLVPFGRRRQSMAA